MRRPFSTITALLLVLMAIAHGLRLWFGWPVMVDTLAISTTTSAAAIGIGIALALGLWFEARMHANLAYFNDRAASSPAPQATASAHTAQSKTFSLRRSARYRAQLVLTDYEQIVDNPTVAALIEEAGFRDVRVTGAGPKRVAEGTWPGSDQTVELPVQVASLTEIAPAIASQQRPEPRLPAPPQAASRTTTQEVDAAREQRPVPARVAIAPTPPPPPANIQPQRVSSVEATRPPPTTPADEPGAQAVASRFAAALGGPAGQPARATAPVAAAGAGSVPSVTSPKPPPPVAD